MDYRGKVVIITGASSGIGREAARAFASRNSVVVGVARREALLREQLERWQRDSPDSICLVGDLGEREFSEQVIAETVARFGRIDVLVHNAAVPKHKQIYDLNGDEAEYVTRVNFLSPVWTTLAAIPHMLANHGGFIVNVSSFAALVPPPRESVYAASKAALNAFSAGLWNDLAGSQIQVSVINPGAIDTEIWDKQEAPNAFRGRKHPPSMIVDAIFEAIEKRRFELVIPRRSLSLMAANFLRQFWPAALRFGMARMDPVPKDVIEDARRRALEARRPRD